MAILIDGPNWPSVRTLRAALAEVPEVGQITWATGHGNKLEQLRVMHAAGVEVPDFTCDFRFVAAQQDLWIGRKFHHKEGKDILFPDKKFWRVRDYWTRFVPSVEEWRIHIFDGKSIARSRKEHVEVLHDKPIRSWRNGWRFKHGPEPPKGLRTFAKAMVAACGYKYGACDILVKADGGFCGLEVNTAPAMDNYTLAAYVRAIRRRFSKEY